MTDFGVEKITQEVQVFIISDDLCSQIFLIENLCQNYRHENGQTDVSRGIVIQMQQNLFQSQTVSYAQEAQRQ